MQYPAIICTFRAVCYCKASASQQSIPPGIAHCVTPIPGAITRPRNLTPFQEYYFRIRWEGEKRSRRIGRLKYWLDHSMVGDGWMEWSSLLYRLYPRHRVRSEHILLVRGRVHFEFHQKKTHLNPPWGIGLIIACNYAISSYHLHI